MYNSRDFLKKLACMSDEHVSISKTIVHMQASNECLTHFPLTSKGLDPVGFYAPQQHMCLRHVVLKKAIFAELISPPFLELYAVHKSRSVYLLRSHINPVHILFL
jgi:hypothetical protein